MSQANNKYRRLEALFSENKPADPDPLIPSVNGGTDAMKVRISELEAELIRQPKSDGQFVSVTSVEHDPTASQARFTKDLAKAPRRSWWPAFLSAPVFEGDVEKTRSSRLLHQIVIASWSLPLLAVLVNFLNPSVGRFALPAGTILAVTLAIIMLLNRAGKTRPASNLMVGMVFIVLTYLNYSGAGEPRPLLLLTVIAIMMSGLLLGRRGPIVVAVLLATQHAVILALYAKGLIVPQSGPAAPLQNALVTTVSYLLIGFMLRLAIERIQFVLNQLREHEMELESRNRELQEFNTSLERRVADRTHDLAMASEVGRTVAEKVSDLSAMLAEATEMIRSRFNLYYTQVYLLDPSGQSITLRAGTGDAGRQLLQRGHLLPVSSSSLNGLAVSERKPVIVADAAMSSTFLPNPLLPNTRSEMAIPLSVGDRVLGVLDMQSEFANALNEDNLAAFQVLAGQLSVAIQNATLFKQSEESRREVEANVRQVTESGWQDFLNAIERGEKIGFTYDQTDVLPMDKMNEVTSTNALTVPITVTGANVGAIQLVEEERRWTAGETEIVQATAAQLAQHIDNLRLLAQAESYRSEAEQAVRRLTREGWQDYSSTVQAETAGYAYDLERVRPLKVNGQRTSEGVTPIPLRVRDEIIGELEVDQEAASEESMEIIQAVARQLSAHIENVRLSEQNELRAAELEKLVTQLRELDRLKSAFLANMSHELRTPLNSILGFADVMLEQLDGPLTENMSNDLGLIQKNGQHLLHLINDVLDMAKIESGKMNLNPETFRVHEILEDVTSITSTLASEKKLGLVIEKDSDNKVEIFADRTRLRQVMINIVNNAIKFTEQGRISIHAARHDGHVVIKVKDTGIGIPQDLLEAVFQEFTQVDISSTRKSGGTGLGLPISRRLIEMHGGRIWAESPGLRGEGTTLNVELPLEAKIIEPIEKQEK